MSKEAQKALLLDSETQKKFEECVAALTAMRFGPDGPPKDTTFAENTGEESRWSRSELEGYRWGDERIFYRTKTGNARYGLRRFDP